MYVLVVAAELTLPPKTGYYPSDLKAKKHTRRLLLCRKVPDKQTTMVLYCYLRSCPYRGF